MRQPNLQVRSKQLISVTDGNVWRLGHGLTY